MSCHREVEKLFPNSYRRARAKIPNRIVAWMLIPRVLSCKSNEISMGLLVVLGHLLIWVKAGALKGFMSIIFKEKPLGTNRIYLKKYGTVSVEAMFPHLAVFSTWCELSSQVPNSSNRWFSSSSSASNPFSAKSSSAARFSLDLRKRSLPFEIYASTAVPPKKRPFISWEVG